MTGVVAWLPGGCPGPLHLLRYSPNNLDHRACVNRKSDVIVHAPRLLLVGLRIIIANDLAS